MLTDRGRKMFVGETDTACQILINDVKRPGQRWYKVSRWDSKLEKFVHDVEGASFNLKRVVTNIIKQN